MYIPIHFRENDPQELARVIQQNNFGCLISMIDDRPFATHLPFVYEPQSGRLLGHMARANPHWEALDTSSREVLTVFQGAHAYISPTWYANPGVPTWNYVAVHLYGHFHVLHDPSAHRQAMVTLTNQHEAAQEKPWAADFESPMAANMLNQTVAFEIIVSETQGKFKLNQNRASEDRSNVIDALEAQATDNSIGIARLMQAKQ
ncbi:MAG: transcriptional regulator [Gammaproteobacteria bacterium]|jgi:transcriptional regulator